jgi:hypothetical protein
MCLLLMMTEQEMVECITNDISSVNYAITGIADDGGTTDSFSLTDITNGTQAAGSFDFEVYWGNAANNRSNADYEAFYVVHGDLA